MDKFNADAGSAILTAARLDSLLQQLLRLAMPEASNTLAKELFDRPLGSFSAKIDVARAMGLIDATAHRDLRAIKGLRNLFAHVERPVHFTSPEVIKKAKQLFAQKCGKGASVRKLFDAAADSAEGAINAKIDSLLYEQAIAE